MMSTKTTRQVKINPYITVDPERCVRTKRCMMIDVVTDTDSGVSAAVISGGLESSVISYDDDDDDDDDDGTQNASSSCAYRHNVQHAAVDH